ncbi:MAG: hypothetical protein JNJ56_14440, partial [Ignavibacteria bacterium]|nr:hypothetical protein [Ignavibacteria bacterium]
MISVKHRNTIETWSKPGSWIVFSQDTASYNFTTAATKAYGDNQKQVNYSPVRYAFFGGDINQDGTLDASDLSSVENAAQDGLSGYIISDVTGDDYVDAADLSLVENNVTTGVSAVIP